MTDCLECTAEPNHNNNKAIVGIVDMIGLHNCTRVILHHDYIILRMILKNEGNTASGVVNRNRSLTRCY